METFFNNPPNIKTLSSAPEQSEFKAALKRFVHFQLDKLFEELGGKSKFFQAFLIVVPEDLYTDDVWECSSNQIKLSKQLSTDFASIEFQYISFDDYYEPKLDLWITFKPFPESVWNSLHIGITTTPDMFNVTYVDFGVHSLTTDDEQWYELTNRIEDYLANERKVLKNS